jgi:hypothetical protein
MVVSDLPSPNPQKLWPYKKLLFKWESIYRIVAEGKGLRFEVCHPKRTNWLYPKILADRVLIEQLLYNLVNNAMKYCYQGTIIKLECIRNRHSKAQSRILSVTNYGREFKCEHPYEFGTRGDNVLDVEEGVGIGLYNAKQIADAHGASLRWSCEQVSEFNIPLVAPYLKLKPEKIDRDLQERLESELARLSESDRIKEIIAISRRGLRLYEPDEDEIVDSLMEPTWQVTLSAELPWKKGTSI